MLVALEARLVGEVRVGGAVVRIHGFTKFSSHNLIGSCEARREARKLSEIRC